MIMMSKIFYTLQFSSSDLTCFLAIVFKLCAFYYRPWVTLAHPMLTRV